MTLKKDINLSVVDQSPTRRDGSAVEALNETVRLAQHAETLGYTRYWVSEHHNSNSFSGTSPEILIAQIAANTKTIRVGSGGVMLSHYSALKVAEQFSILDSFHPNRIDLGIGRAPGSDRKTAAALTFPRPTMDVFNDFPQMVNDLLGFLKSTITPDNPLYGIQAQPSSKNTFPEIWLLGSSDFSAKLAAQLGLPFSFADFFGNTSDYGPKITQIYREQFQPSEYLSEPKVHIGLQVFCADTEEQARFIGSSRNINKILSLTGRAQSGLMPPEEATQINLTFQEKLYLEQSTQSFIEGDPSQVEIGILKSSERYETNEIGIVTNCYYFEDRLKSYELVSKIFNQTPVENVKIN